MTTKSEIVTFAQSLISKAQIGRSAEDASLAASHARALADLQSAQAAEVDALAAARAAEDAKSAALFAMLALIPEGAEVPSSAG